MGETEVGGKPHPPPAHFSGAGRKEDRRMTESQIKFVGDYIKKHKKGISSKEAFDFGITRLSSAIYILRHRRGFEIESVPCKCKNRYGGVSCFVRYVYRGERA